MKTFMLGIFKGKELKETKRVTVNSPQELQKAKRIFWSESKYKQTSKNWIGTKRIK